VCGEEAAAQRAAEVLLRAGQASAALVEEAQLVVGTASLMQYYERTDSGGKPGRAGASGGTAH
jgi:hypothetical protein